ncbi:MAG: hypothetical protein AB9856_12030 [Cellulosilyticaceae bacterium]
MDRKKGFALRSIILMVVVLVAVYFYGDVKKTKVVYEEGEHFFATLLQTQKYTSEAQTILTKDLEKYFTQAGYQNFINQDILLKYEDYVKHNNVTGMTDLVIEKADTGTYKDFLIDKYIIRYKLATNKEPLAMKDTIRLTIDKPTLKIKSIELLKTSSILK